DLPIGNRRRQVRLAAARGATEHKPPQRCFAHASAAFKGLFEAREAALLDLERIEGLPGQVTEIAAPSQSIAHLARAASARDSSPKVGIVQINVPPEKTVVLADWTVRLGLWLGWLIRRAC